MKKHINPNKISSEVRDYLNPQGKLTELGIMLIVDALLINREDLLPTKVLEYLQKNPEVQEDVFEYYHALRQLNTSYLRIHPYFNPRSRQRFRHQKQLKIGSAVLLMTVLLGTYWFIYFAKRMTPIQPKLNTPTKISSQPPEFKASELKVDYVQFDQDQQKLIVPKNQAKKFALANGSELIIPEEAFVNQKGEKIQEDIEIKYREFHKAAEIIASNIPMEYDSAGVSYPFESAGMFEIRAFQTNGQEVFMAKDKSIQVNMAADGQEGSFNHYYLEEKTNKKPQWKLLGASQLKNTETSSATFEYDSASIIQEQVILEDGQEAIRTRIQIDGETYDLNREMQDKPSFRLKFDLKKYPELKPFTKLYWKWQNMGDLTENPYVNSWVLDTPWEHIELNPLTQERYDSMNFALPERIDQIEFNKEETRLILAARGGKAQMIDLVSGKTTYFENSWTAKFSPDERYILTTLDDVRLWSLDGELIHNYGTPEYGVRFAKFSPNGKYVLICSQENHIKLYDLQGNFITRIWAGSKNIDYALSSFEINNFRSEEAYFTPDSRYIIVKSIQGDYQSWTMKGKAIPLNYDRPFPKTGQTVQEVIQNQSLLDVYVKQASQLEKIYAHLHQSQKNASKQTLLDFELHKNHTNLYTTDKFLLDLLIKPSKAVARHGVFSPKGTYLIVHESHPANKDSKSYLAPGSFTFWKRNPQAAKKQAQRYEMLLSKALPDGGERGFRTIVQKISPQDVKEEKKLARIIKAQRKKIQKAQKIAQVQAQDEARLVRVFKINQLGIYNVDRIHQMENAIMVKADFQWKDAPKDTQAPIRIYHICGKNQSVVISYPKIHWHKFKFNPEDQNQLIAILPNSKVAYLNSEDFQKINTNKAKQTGQHTFQMHTKAISGSLDDLKAILN